MPRGAGRIERGRTWRLGARSVLSSTSKSTLAALLAISAGAVVCFLTIVEGFWFFLFLATLVVSAVGAPLLHRRGSTRDALSPLSLAAVFYLLGYAAGGLYFWLDPQPNTPLLEKLPHTPSRSDLTMALGLATLGWLLFVAGYVGSPLKRVTAAFPGPPRVADIQSVALLVAPLLIVGWVARLALLGSHRYFHNSVEDLVATGSSYVTFVIGNLPLLATALIGAYSYLSEAARGNTKYRKAFWILALVEIGWALPTGSRAQLISVLLSVLVVVYYGNGRVLPVKTLVVAGAFVILVLFPFALHYRNDATDYRLEPGKALNSAASETLSGSTGAIVDAGLVATVARFSDVASLAEIVGQGRSQFTRPPGQTLAWTVEGLIPRAVYPSKPDPGAFGNEFGRSFGLISSTNYVTSVATTQPGEFFLNFGIAGILLLAPLVGAVYRLIGDYLRARGSEPVALALYAVVAGSLLLSHETILANGLVGLIKMLVSFAVAIAMSAALLARWRSPLRSARPTGSTVPSLLGTSGGPQ